MSHNVHPFSHRLGIIRDWKSRWFKSGKEYKDLLKSDVVIREYLDKSLRSHHIASVDIERSAKATRVIIQTSRPGMIIGRSGEGAVKLKQGLLKAMRKSKVAIPEDFKIDIVDVPDPDSNAAIVASMVAESLEKRMQFRRVMKTILEKVSNVRGVKGVRIVLAGRLGGAEMSRKEEVKHGSIPLQFLRADVDYARDTARLPYGGIGVKVWIYKGDTLEQTS